MHTIVSTLNQHLTRDLIQKHKTKKKKGTNKSINFGKRSEKEFLLFVKNMIINVENP